jgi:hypothetical protein
MKLRFDNPRENSKPHIYRDKYNQKHFPSLSPWFIKKPSYCSNKNSMLKNDRKGTICNRETFEARVDDKCA